MKEKRERILWPIIFCLFLIGVGILLQININRVYDQRIKILDDHWDISIAGNQYKDVTLSVFKLPVLHKGESVALTQELEDATFQQTVLRIRTRYSSVTVFLDGKEIYTYGTDFYEQGQMIGNGYHWVALPENYAGKELKIVYQIGEENAFGTMDQIRLMDSLQTHSDLLSRNMVTVVIACCLFVIGLVCILCIALVGVKDSRFQMLLWLGLFAIFVSTWMLCNGRLVDSFYQNLHVTCHVEYLSMYGACISMLYFVAAFLKKEPQKKLFWKMAGGFAILCTVLTVLSVTNLVHFPKTVLIFQIVAIILTVSIIYVLAKEAHRSLKAERTFLAGIVCFFVSVLLELMRYRYNKFCLPVHRLNQSVIPIGAMFFILAMFGSFFFRIMERVAEELERKTLYDMAYEDALTNIKNRAWCEKVMQDYKSSNTPITIINLDLNLFKEVNDTFGHAKGDELLIRFASILSSIFRENDCVGRMGGDEFIVISDYIPDEVVEKHMEALLERLTLENTKKGYAYQISVSFGYASDATGQCNPWKIYEQADKKMYEYKEKTRKDGR